MSGVAIVAALLVADTALVARVPAARIRAGILEEGTQLPAIVVTTVSGTDMNMLRPAGPRRSDHRVQVTVFARTYADQMELIRLVRAACADTIEASLAGFSDVVVLTDLTGPDMYDEDAKIFMQPQDFRVSFNGA